MNEEDPPSYFHDRSRRLKGRRSKVTCEDSSFVKPKNGPVHDQFGMGNIKSPRPTNRRYSFSFYGLQVAFCGLLIWVVVINIGLYFAYHDPSQIKRSGDGKVIEFQTLEDVLFSLFNAVDTFGLGDFMLIQPEVLCELQQSKDYTWSSFALRERRVLTFLFLDNERLPSCSSGLDKLAEAINAPLFCKEDLSHALMAVPAATFHFVAGHRYSQDFIKIPSLNDTSVSLKLWTMGISERSPLLFLNNSGLLYRNLANDRIKTVVDGVNICLPKDIAGACYEVQRSTFISCDEDKAAEFYADFPEIQVESGADADFRRKVRQILTLVKEAFAELKIAFWISSGTLLGWFRQCDVIPYSGDVDIGVMIDDHSSDIVPSLDEKGLQLRMKLGTVNDSLQYSFVYSQTKLDIYFFYSQGDQYWNGATKPETGEKYKYTFPRFDLCWTEFLDLQLRVPCPVLPYIEANYGSGWDRLVRDWDWRLSPPNAVANGRWDESVINETVQIFEVF